MITSIISKCRAGEGRQGGPFCFPKCNRLEYKKYIVYKNVSPQQVKFELLNVQL
jgi:hypothetical protein